MMFSIGVFLGVVAGFITGCRMTNRQYAEILKTAQEADELQKKIVSDIDEVIEIIKNERRTTNKHEGKSI